MNVIYAYANHVLSWLGPRYISLSSSPEDDGEFGVKFLGEKLPDRMPDEREVRAVRAVIDRRESTSIYMLLSASGVADGYISAYWTRCWIIQEICFSKKVLIMCGQGRAEFTPKEHKRKRQRSHQLI